MKTFNADQPIDLSLPLSTENKVKCFYAPDLSIEPVKEGDFIGDTLQGGVLNFKNVTLNPHGNGTHTECVGHISTEVYTINQCLTRFLFDATLISITPETQGEDRVITKKLLEQNWQNYNPALVIRTLPNEGKKAVDYSGQNPPYLSEDAMQFVVEKGVKHLLVDLPSVDPAEDGGKLLAHRAFWQYPSNTRVDATITELIFVPDEITDGEYVLNLQIAPFELDASPSKPILYPLS